MHRAERGEAGLAEVVVKEVLGDDPGPKELGEFKIERGSSGRGAEGWAAVAEWALDASGQGLIGGGAYAAGLWLWRKLTAVRKGNQPVLVSRGAAVLIAAAYVMEETGSDETLELEAAEDPVTMRGGRPSEEGYAGVEPWIICFVDEPHRQRHVVVVRADGEPVGLTTMTLRPIESLQYRPNEIDLIDRGGE